MKRLKIKEPVVIIGVIAVLLAVAACVFGVLYFKEKRANESAVTILSEKLGSVEAQLEAVTAEYGDATAQLDECKNKLTELEASGEEERTALNEQIESLEKTVSDKESQIAELNKLMEQIKSLITAETGYQASLFADLFTMVNDGAPDTVINDDHSGETTVRRPKVSLCYEDIETGYSFGYYENEVKFGASMVKAAYVTALLEEISEYETDIEKNGTEMYSGDGAKYDLDAPWTYERRTMYVEGSGEIQNQPDGFATTTRGLIVYTIIYSDNIAFAELQKKFGTARFYKNAEALGIKGVKSGFYNMSAQEAVTYMREIYRFAEENQKYGAYFKDLLSRAVHKLMIPASLRANAIHKYGWDENSYCDMMIIYGEHPYIVCVMTDMENGTDADNAYIQSLIAKVDEIHRSNAALCG